MTTLAEAWGLSRGDSGLAVVSTLRAKTTAATVLLVPLENWVSGV